jgi:uncharacterized membrane protein YeaQ/YmgE (transglycosylase-associated protein family)
MIWTLIIGGLAGWLASTFMRGAGMGIMWNIILGIIGAIVGDWLFGIIGVNVNLGSQTIEDIVVATAGAIVVLFAVNKFRGRR